MPRLRSTPPPSRGGWSAPRPPLRTGRVAGGWPGGAPARPGWRWVGTWERLGARLYRDDTASVGVLVGRRWQVGGRVELDRLSLDAGPPRRHLRAAACCRAPLATGLCLIVDWPLSDPPPWYGVRGLDRWIVLAGEGEGTAWRAALDRRADGTPSLQAEALVRLGRGIAWGIRWDAASGAMGVCTAWRRGALVLRSSHLVHADLGTTHRWSLGALR
ncbi:MAG: hypothetical protein R3D98_08790 [Candidatus Krumholzibacteriia bacterium]